MKAVRIHSFGGPEVLVYEDAPRPTMGGDEVLVRVHAASINPVERFVRGGYLQGRVEFTLPLILGLDLSGVVEAVGPGVTGIAVGDAVYGYSNMMRQGAYAEYAAVGANEVAPKPKTIDHVAASAVPLAGLTAWQALDLLGLTGGQSVLVHGAGGGVGTFAVQFAVQRGVRVLATAAAHNGDLLRALGVDQVIDYTITNFEDVVDNVDGVLDLVGGDVQARSLAVLKPGGVLVTTAGQPDAAAAEASGVRALGMMAYADPTQLALIGGLIDAGAVKPVVSEVFPLAEARQAHALAERGHAQGKIVLRVV